MKLKNTTDWPDHFVRRLVSWCCKQLDTSPKKISSFKLRNRNDGFTSGHCYSGWGQICVSLGVVNLAGGQTLVSGDVYRARTLNDLVKVTAHEIAHRMLHIVGVRTRISRRYHGSVNPGGSEAQTRWHEQKVYEAFDADRVALLEAWMRPVARARVEVSAVDRRAAKATADLERWQRKLRLAQTKVSKLKKRVRYYAGKQAETVVTA